MCVRVCECGCIDLAKKVVGYSLVMRFISISVDLRG